MGFFVLVVLGFNAIQDRLLEDDLYNRLDNMANQVALAVSQAYESGRTLNEIDEDTPVVRVFLDLPPTIAGYQYVVKYEEGKIIASTRGKESEADLLGIQREVTINGKITGSSVRKPSISYYKSEKRIVLENVR